MLFGKRIATILAKQKLTDETKEAQHAGKNNADDFGNQQKENDQNATAFANSQASRTSGSSDPLSPYPAYTDAKLGILKHQPLSPRFEIKDLCNVVCCLGRLKIRSKLLLYLITHRFLDLQAHTLCRRIDAVSVLRLVAGLAQLYGASEGEGPSGALKVSGGGGPAGGGAAGASEAEMVKRLLLHAIKPVVRKLEMTEQQREAFSVSLFRLGYFEEMFDAHNYRARESGKNGEAEGLMMGLSV